MSIVRISVMVDEELLQRAREVHGEASDASLIERALRSLPAFHRHAEVDAGYKAYDKRPLDTPDAWGDLATWVRAQQHS